MMRTNYGTAGFLMAVVVLLQGCESTDSTDSGGPIEGPVDNQADAFIEDVPMMADSFVLQTFELDAQGKPVDVDAVVLLREE